MRNIPVSELFSALQEDSRIQITKDESGYLDFKGDIEWRDIPNKGRGVIATKDIAPGSILMVCRPISHINVSASSKPLTNLRETFLKMKKPKSTTDEEEEEPKVEWEISLLIIRLIDLLKKTKDTPKEHTQLLHTLSQLHPKTPKNLAKWTSKNPQLDSKLLKLHKTISNDPQEANLLFWKVQLNALGMYQYSDTIFYEKDYAKDESLGLYLEGSFFNHSCLPNAHRYNVGEAMVYVSNQRVAAGTELSICYYETEYCVEPYWVRAIQLGRERDFSCDCSLCVTQKDSNVDYFDAEFVPEPKLERFEIFDDEMLEELNSLSAEEKLGAISEIISQSPQDEGRPLWKDFHLCQLMRCLANVQLLRTSSALHFVCDSIRKIQKHYPSSLQCEMLTSLFLLRARILCMQAEEPNTERIHKDFQQALLSHQIIFGGEKQYFFSRLRSEIAHLKEMCSVGQALWESEWRSFEGEEGDKKEKKRDLVLAEDDFPMEENVEESFKLLDDELVHALLEDDEGEDGEGIELEEEEEEEEEGDEMDEGDEDEEDEEDEELEFDEAWESDMTFVTAKAKVVENVAVPERVEVLKAVGEKEMSQLAAMGKKVAGLPAGLRRMMQMQTPVNVVKEDPKESMRAQEGKPPAKKLRTL